MHALHQQPFADVLYAMYQAISRPGAHLVLGDSDVLAALQTSLTDLAIASGLIERAEEGKEPNAGHDGLSEPSAVT